MRFKKVISTLALGSAIAGCSMDDEFTDQEWQQIRALEPLKGGRPHNRVNARDEDVELAKFGQMLFFEKDVAEAITVAGPSGNVGELRKVGCVNCHDTPYFADSHLTSPGALANNGLVPGLSHGRSYLATNTGQMVNIAWNEWTLWAGRFDSPMDHGAAVWGTSATPLAQARFIYAKYKTEYDAVFPETPLDDRLGIPPTDPTSVFPATGGPAALGGAPGAFEMMPADAQNAIHQFRANLAKAFDTYPRMLTTPDSPFERYVKGDRSALTGAQKRGLRLFIGKAACSDCHNGPTLSDNKFHNIGAPNISILPGNPANQAPNRGRATTVAAQVVSLTYLDLDENNPTIYNGASKWSDDRDFGRAKLEALRTQDREHCTCRRVDPVADAAACAKIAPKTQLAFQQEALKNDDSLECLVTDGSGQCTCRKTDTIALTSIDRCTAIATSVPAQSTLNAETAVACLKYDDTLEGMFRTPPLLNVALTAPYFHSGSVQTLEEVVWFYNQGGGSEGTFAGRKSPQLRPLLLTEAEISDLVAFLRSLTGKTPAQVAEEARDNATDPSTVWDWSKNTAKPPLPAATGAGGMGGSAATGRGGAGGAGGAAGSGAAGTGGSAPGGAGGAGGAGGTGA